MRNRILGVLTKRGSRVQGPRGWRTMLRYRHKYAGATFMVLGGGTRCSDTDTDTQALRPHRADPDTDTLEVAFLQRIHLYNHNYLISW